MLRGPTPCRLAAPPHLIGKAVEPNPAFKIAPILLDAQRRQLQRLVGRQPEGGRIRETLEKLYL
jgi:hypothetical protein